MDAELNGWNTVPALLRAYVSISASVLASASAPNGPITKSFHAGAATKRRAAFTLSRIVKISKSELRSAGSILGGSNGFAEARVIDPPIAHCI